MRNLLLICFSVIALSGCSSAPPLNFTVQSIQPANHKIDAELKSVSVSLATDAEKKGNIEAGMEILPQLWKASLDDALARNTAFKDDASKKVNIVVKVLAMNLPSIGTTMTSTSIAQYQIIDRENGKALYTKEISADGVVPFSYSLMGSIRSRESINRAVQNNIAAFLTELDNVNIEK
ncbi:UDP-N-acetylglucosamine acyltransferase [Proteus vulgaris]|uniref:UDP-N-acetylglucosamine acyltransferase n=1 Tax=Proteus vulgaris TaxID=585 RepID=UPI001B35CEF2|nr:UDP-N-acetylglucosamine acyltransferase [Proteus vulgaris]MBQ0213961.1 UDP-N-acetylglucosamine acyltransferase [Proteus vulgaris]MDS0788927.1 UDP-N-acetylglucosamine acyltransferase [Proteus vulgaris]